MKIPAPIRKAIAEATGATPTVRPRTQQYADLFNEAAGQLGIPAQVTRSGSPVFTVDDLTNVAEYLRQSGEQPVTRQAQERAQMAAERLNAGRMYFDEQLPSMEGIDHGVLRGAVDLPMDEAARMTRAREQGYTYGIDEDLWRGVTDRGNTRSNPLEYSVADLNNVNTPYNIETPAWATDRLERAREYTRLPYRVTEQQPNMLAYSNQDWLAGLPEMMIRDGSMGVPLDSAGSATFRVAGQGTPLEYHGTGEHFRDIARDRMTYDGGPLPSGLRLDEYNNPDWVVKREKHFREGLGEAPQGAVFHNIQDPGPNRGPVSPSYADTYALPYERARARDLAMFHPLLRGRRGMLLGTGGAAAAPYLTYGIGPQEQ